MRAVIPRREFLRAGSLPLLGLGLADLLRLQHASAAPATARSCILIWLDGGPSHLDTFDPKPDAPSEVRGDFRAIPTSLDGLQICEHLPLLARRMHRTVLIRSLTHELGNHDTGSHYLLTGHRPNPSLAYPSVGSILSRTAGSGGALPPYVAVPSGVSSMGAGYFPSACAPFDLGGDPGRPDYRVRDLAPPASLPSPRIEARRRYVDQLEAFSRRTDAGGGRDGRDAFFEQAYRLIASPESRAAFDLSAEPAAVRQAYGRSRLGAGCLLARRLVAAGVRCVGVVDRGWDTHQQIFRELPDSRFPGSGRLPSFDRAVSALIDDLADRGLLESTLVVVMGEFGRTPKLNSAAGRDHWPRAGFALLAGGGLPAGRVIGATDPHGEAPVDRPVRPEDLAWTLLSRLGVDSNREFRTPDGRPMRLLASGGPIPGL